MVFGDYSLLNIFPAFIYTMPGYNCSIKDRMLYSSCKKAVTDVIESLGIEIHKKVRLLSNCSYCRWTCFELSAFNLK